MTNTVKKQFNFKKTFEELEEISDWFGKEDIDLDVGLKKFKQGMELVEQAKKHLKEVENEFKKIKKPS